MRYCVSREMEMGMRMGMPGMGMGMGVEMEMAATIVTMAIGIHPTIWSFARRVRDNL